LSGALVVIFGHLLRQYNMQNNKLWGLFAATHLFTHLSAEPLVRKLQRFQALQRCFERRRWRQCKPPPAGPTGPGGVPHNG
jgi:hypothetical protein